MKVIGNVNGWFSDRQPMPGATPDHVPRPRSSVDPRGRRFRSQSAKAAIQPHARSQLQLSEIRLVRGREHGFLSGGVVSVFRAFGADIFHPFT
jgi:hypothetical protein